MSDKDLTARLREVERQTRIAEAFERDRAIRSPVPGARPIRASLTDAPPPNVGVGERLAFGSHPEEPRSCWFLQGRVLEAGDAIEVYTNAANGWIRGRFEWVEPSAPRLILNVWDPCGARDDSGLPPLVGELATDLPREAVCRWPSEPAQ